MANREKLFRRVIATIIVLIILIPCSVLIYDTVTTSGEETVEFYYMSGDGSMKPMEKNIRGENREDTLMTVLNTLKEGPKVEGISPSVPQEVEVLSVGLVNDIAMIDVSNGYRSLKNTEEVICRSSIVWTLTSLEYVDGVEITIEGVPLYSSTGGKIGPMNRHNVIIDGGEISAETTEYAILTLYFANGDGTDLAPEERVVEVNSNQTKEKTVLEQLIAGPAEKELRRTIPAETKIRDVTTTNDGTCYVNLSEDFVTKHIGGKREELLTVYSIVNSLCELDHIDKVQFLIEGKKLEEFKGDLQFKTPFTAVSSLKMAEAQ